MNNATITLNDVPDTSLEELRRRISGFSSPLIKLFFDPPGVPTAGVVGAGTFIQVENIYGLLTAYHVARELLHAQALGLPLLEAEDNFSIKRDDFEIIDIATPASGEIGPDIAFLRLPVEVSSRISRCKNFFSLSDNRDELLNHPPPIDDRIWGICGSPEENVRVENSTTGFDYVIGAQLFCGFGGVEIEDTVGGYDYFRMLAKYQNGIGVPMSIKGMSGGGLWQILVTLHNDKQVSAKRYLLSGLMFWRSGAIGKPYAKSHGRFSLYHQVYNAILEKCA